MKSKRIYLILIILSLCWFGYINVKACEYTDEKMKPDSVSTGTELIEWLELHKNTGGKVRLSDNVVLEGVYYYCPDVINLPHVFIDTNNYTITITGEIEFRSDHHLIFQGHTKEKKNIIHVAKGGMLSLSGIIIENSENKILHTLWQEEGAGLVIEDCRISGKIHYANTPFVVDNEFVCAVVEKNQTAGDVLPTEIKCSVNLRGQMQNNEQMKISWNLSGTEKEQKERLRFSAEGSFFDAAFLKPPVCTVVYNDYMLTFMNVKGERVSERSYLFRGDYMKLKEYLPMMVTYEYSFDGENWTSYEESIASNVVDSFFIGLTSDQWDTEKYPYLYLRLMGKYNGNTYFSNVLRYTADNLKIVEDQGGNRGGGTSIVNPPKEPQITPDDASHNKNDETIPEIKQENSFDENLDVKDNNTKTEIVDAEVNVVHPDIVNAEITSSEENKVFPKTIIEYGSQNLSETETVTIENINQNTNNSGSGRDHINYNISDGSDEKIQMRHLEESSYLPDTEIKENVRKNKEAIVVSGIVFSSVLVGSAGYCFHAGILSKLLQFVKMIGIK